MADVTKQWAASDIPDDLLMEILLKLPVRSLLLFSSVSKHWLSLIQNPNFTRLHFNRPINNLNDNHQQPLLIVRSIIHKFPTRLIIFTFLSHDETLAYNDDVSLHLLSPPMASSARHSSWYKSELLGPCNGLFCLTNSVDFVLINPATRQTRKVTSNNLSPSIRCSDQFIGNNVGFGFDSICNDFKLVRFEDVIQQEDEYNDDYGYDHDLKVEIFSLSTSCWRELTCVVRAFNKFCLHSCSMFFNGAFHWVGGDECYIDFILVFDLNKEESKQFKLPDKCKEDLQKMDAKLSVLNKFLAMIVYEVFEDFGNNGFAIWVMTKYGLNTSWSKLYNYCVVEGIRRPLSFYKNDEFLLENADGQLVSFSLNTRETKKFQVHGVMGSMHAFRYRESLVSLY